VERSAGVEAALVLLPALLVQATGGGWVNEAEDGSKAEVSRPKSSSVSMIEVGATTGVGTSAGVGSAGVGSGAVVPVAVNARPSP